MGRLEAEVGEGAVGLGLLVNVVALADGVPLPLKRHLSARWRGRGASEPGLCDHGRNQRSSAWRGTPERRRRNFERHLVGGTTDAAGLDLNTRLGVFNGAS
jgi:hypothetical protein